MAVKPILGTAETGSIRAIERKTQDIHAEGHIPTPSSGEPRRFGEPVGYDLQHPSTKQELITSSILGLERRVAAE
jgi:hypothetical protein